MIEHVESDGYRVLIDRIRASIAAQESARSEERKIRVLPENRRKQIEMDIPTCNQRLQVGLRKQR